MIWRTCEIGSFLKERKDRFKPAEANTLGLKRIEKIDFSGHFHIVDNKHTKTNMILVKKADLVISGINVEKGALGVYEGDDDVLATIHYSSYEYDNKQINIEYLKWFLKSKTFQHIVKEEVGGGIKTELKPKRFLPLKIKLPELEEQLKIVRKINSVKQEINELDRINNENENLLIKLCQAILQEAIKGKLVPQDFNDKPASELLKRINSKKRLLQRENQIRNEKDLPPIISNSIPFDIPENWTWCYLTDLALKITDGEHKTPDYVDVGIPFVSAKNIVDNKICFDNTKYITKEAYIKYIQRCNPEKGDLLITKSGSIGRVCIVKTDKKFSLFESVALFKPIEKEIETKYLGYVVELFAHSEGNVKGLAVKHLPLNMIKQMKVPLPPHEEQKRIVCKVDQLMNHCDELEIHLGQSIKNSEMLMQAVLQEVFDFN